MPAPPRPLYAVWELTLRCDQPCRHCGARAGRARPGELSPEDALRVAERLADLGLGEVTLIGGEAYLRPDAPALISRLTARGVAVTMLTGGRAFDLSRAREFRDAGLKAVAVSVDGPEEVHDLLRGRAGSWAAAMRALDAARAVGLPTAVNMQINRLNADRLPETAAAVRARQARWLRPQLTAPMGGAADHPEWILEPWRVPAVIDALAAIQADAEAHPHPWERPTARRGFRVQLGNNLGYHGPHDAALREGWIGCRAGVEQLAVEADGTLKGCPSLPTSAYAAGHVLNDDLAARWADAPALGFARAPEERWGFCAECAHGPTCGGGCAFTAHATLGRRGNNPFCDHRARSLAARGLRERLVPVERAPSAPFGVGRFEIVVEPGPVGGMMYEEA